MSKVHAITMLAEWVSLSRPRDAAAFDAIAIALADDMPAVADQARLTATLLRESERAQLTLSQILEESRQ